jgi:non-heme chloroperoxidase
MVTPQSGGELTPKEIRKFNYLPVIDLNMPKQYRDGTETLTYSYRLNTGYAPKNYKKNFKSMHQKALIVIGSADESFVPEMFEPAVSKYKKDVNVKIINNATHMGLVMGKEIRPVLKEWINGL